MQLKKVLALAAMILVGTAAFAQNSIKAVLVDSVTGEYVGFATASLSKDGQTKPYKYVLSTKDGAVLLESVRNGSYTFKAEMMGYKTYEKTVKISGKSLDLGELKMVPDAEQLDAAKISAVGAPIIIKKDTVEYNASSYNVAENDMLEDLLKKLPGIEIDENGAITYNGESITKIMVDGKTFFLDDPSVASKNLPARIINKLKVIKKKSDQAEFTGIDDGEEENIIDLSVKPGMMKGLMGNFQAGAGRDIPSEMNVNDDFRYLGNGFVGRFVKGSHVSVVLNSNNTNNRGSTDRSGNMMNSMTGGGASGGITTSYMAGVNAAGDFFDDKMELGGHYSLNHSNQDVENETYRVNYLDDHNLISNSESIRNQVSGGHSIGGKLEHKFTENTSIVFEPQIHFGTGSYHTQSSTATDYDPLDESAYKLNEAVVNNIGSNKNLSTSGSFLFRQRLGMPGRTLTASVKYSLSNNELDALNYNNTTTFDSGGNLKKNTVVDQSVDRSQKSRSMTGRVSYTEPLGGDFYAEANYSYSWSQSSSDKATYNNSDGSQDYTLSNIVVNRSQRHHFGANLKYQKKKMRAQVGFTGQFGHTFKSTTQYDEDTGLYQPREYTDDRWNWAPQVSLYGDINDNTNVRVNYRGQSSQPSTSQLMPVPNNTNPLRLSFGNPSLTPYFTHNANFNFRWNNRAKFTSLNFSLNGSIVQNPIVNAIWYNASGAQFSMPFNGRNSGNFGGNLVFNTPIAQSDFSISNTLGGRWSTQSSYVGSNVNMDGYPDPMEDYYSFMNKFIEDRPVLDEASDFDCNITRSLSFNERFRAVYRTEQFEMSLGGRTRLSISKYSLKPDGDLTTWGNQLSARMMWKWKLTGLGFRADYDYNWYVGYKTDRPDENVLNAEITKLLFKDKMTIALRGWDILAQSRTLSVSDTDNYHSESLYNTLGRYVILSLSYRFGAYGKRNGR